MSNDLLSHYLVYFICGQLILITVVFVMLVFEMSAYTSHLLQIWNVTRRVPLELSSSASSQMLESLSKLVKFFIETAVRKRLLSDDSLAIRATTDCLETVRFLCALYCLSCIFVCYHSVVMTLWNICIS